MIHFEGEETFGRPAAEVADKLSDPRFLTACLPELQDVRADETSAAWKIKPAFSFASGVLDNTLTVADRAPGESVKYAVTSKGVGAGSAMTIALAFAPDGDGTRVRWAADITEMTGLLKMVPRGLIQAAAQKVIGDVWASVGRALGGTR